MKSKYILAFVAVSTITFSACDSTNTQGLGANADGTCNSSIQTDAQSFVSQMMSAESNIDSDQLSASAGLGNFGDVQYQVQTAKSACNAFVAKYGSTVCNSTDANGNTQTFDGSKLSQACAQIPDVISNCDSNMLNAYANLAASAQIISPYVNDDGTLNATGQANPSMFAEAASSVSTQCSTFEASYQNASSCSINVGSTAYPVNVQAVNTLCAEIKTAESQPVVGLPSAMPSLSEIKITSGAISAPQQISDLSAELKKAGL